MWVERRTILRVCVALDVTGVLRFTHPHPQGSSLSPDLFILYRSDLVKCLEAHPGHIFADDLSVIIKAPFMICLSAMIEHLEREDTKSMQSNRGIFEEMETTCKCTENGGPDLPLANRKTETRNS